MAPFAAMGVLETPRLRLVPLGLDEAEAMVGGVRPKTARWAPGYPTETSLVAAAMLVAAGVEGRRLEPFGPYQVVRESDDLVLGDCTLLGPPDEHGSLHVVCSIAPGFRRQRHGSEALRALLAWAHEQPGVRRVLADTAVTNTGAVGLALAAGMREVGRDERLVYFEG